ncbi:hypothetical protein HYS79_00445 [Patescibacteria group bacterium]|nr:hypothetical protein [Patescibacteria group bacterium]
MISYKIRLVFASRIFGLNAAKEKLEIVSGAAPRLRRGFGGQAPPFRIFAGLRLAEAASATQAGDFFGKMRSD